MMSRTTRPTETEPNGSTFCPSCGTVGYGDDSYCACCGDRMIRGCGSCGSRILQPLANYCTRCGVPLIDAGNDGGKIGTGL